MEKYTFISKLFSTNNLTDNQKKRLIQLTAKELTTSTLKEKDILDFINDFEKKALQSDKTKNISNNDKELKIQHHNPKKVVEILKYFTLDNTAIKYSTHMWDDMNSYSTYNDFITGVKERNSPFYDLQNYNKDLFWNKIFPFLFQEEFTNFQKSDNNQYGWGKYKIKIGWQFPSILKDWCKNNYDNKGIKARSPFVMPLPKELCFRTKDGKTIQTFENVVSLFKEEIEFRDNNLYTKTKALLDEKLPNHEYHIEELKSLKKRSFYTNVESIILAIGRIFDMIKSRSESLRIEVRSTETDNGTLNLEIIHLNSFSDSYINEKKLMLKENTGDLFSLRQKLISLCDFSITSRFKDEENKLKCAKIEYLYNGVEENNWEPKISYLDEKSLGFKFNLKFYK